MCSDCGNRAQTQEQYCEHVNNKTAWGEINVGLKPIEYSLVVQPAEPGQKYGGIGFNIGGSIDYWMKDLPIALRFFGNGYFIPQPPPWPELKTMFGSVGLSVVVILKRHGDKNNLN